MSFTRKMVEVTRCDGPGCEQVRRQEFDMPQGSVSPWFVAPDWWTEVRSDHTRHYCLECSKKIVLP